MSLNLTIPLIPPSANLYTRLRVVPMKGRMLPTFYHTTEAKAWWKAVATVAAGRQIASMLYRVAFIVYFPPRSRMDIDNANKCVLDGLTKAGVIRDDRYVIETHAYKVKVATEGEARTEIFVREAGKLNMLDSGAPDLGDWA